MILMNNIVLAFAVGSNHALQRTAPCVTELGVVMPLRITNKVLAVV